MKYLYSFLAAFGLNWIWENLHSVLYAHYQGHEISQFVLARAAIFDAIFILIIVWLATRLFKSQRPRMIFIIIVGLILAVGIEWWALETGRWTYAAAMPIVPFINAGLTPTIQLALTGYLAYLVVFGKKKVSTINQDGGQGSSK